MLLMKDGQPIILIECKHHNEKLDPHNSQLFRYFHTTKAKFGLLTNGLNYRFYTDLVETNKMDDKPFFEFNISDMKEVEVLELKKFHKSYFDVEAVTNTASELKYSNEIKNIMSNELKNPSEAFVKFFVSQVYHGRATDKVMTQFVEIVRKSLNQLISDMISDRLKSALDKEITKETEQAIEQIIGEPVAKVPETTEEEIEAFFIVKSILRKKVDSHRIFGRDTQSYYGILLDDSNRKIVCRLWLNGTKKYISFLDESKKDIKHEITQLDDIYDFTDQLLLAVENYEVEVIK
jgi:hypothetical protein